MGVSRNTDSTLQSRRVGCKAAHLVSAERPRCWTRQGLFCVIKLRLLRHEQCNWFCLFPLVPLHYFAILNP